MGWAYQYPVLQIGESAEQNASPWGFVQFVCSNMLVQLLLDLSFSPIVLFISALQVVLSKFVRQMGDLLPSTLYIPYLRMLKGLANGPQSSHYCFSLLKTNGAPHGKGLASGYCVKPTLYECTFSH